MWNEPTLVSFLLVMLLYATYQPLRFAIEDPERQARAASVFAITAGVFVPINFAIVRLSTAYVHPRTLDNISGNLPGRMQVVFWLVDASSIALLWLTLWRYEMTSKHASAQLRALRRLLLRRRGRSGPLRRSAAPTMTSVGGAADDRRRCRCTSAGGRYVAAAYIVFVALILLYVAIMAGKLGRIERELGELTELARCARRRRSERDEP